MEIERRLSASPITEIANDTGSEHGSFSNLIPVPACIVVHRVAISRADNAHTIPRAGAKQVKRNRDFVVE